jgi:nicotinamidase-related amidase
MLHLALHSQRLTRDPDGYDVWEVVTTARKVPAKETALVLCDVWDQHWCRAATERLDKMVARMNQTVVAARDKGVLIVHAPSDTLKQYADHPARRRALEAPKVEPPADIEHEDPPLPVKTDDQTGCDARPAKVHYPWTKQHAAIEIDPDRDIISADGRELYGVYRARGIRTVLIMGVHTNMCILARNFAIKQMVRWGFDTALVRDLTDTIYSPLQWPYVSHDEGTRLVVGYIEKFWCPTLLSNDLLR